MKSNCTIRHTAAIVLGVSMLALVGCASPTAPTGFGYYATDASPELNAKLVRDSVRQLTALYPPAHTRFNFTHSATDAFGAALITELRAKGYAVAEAAKPGSAPSPSAADDQAGNGPVSSVGGIDLRYIVDRQGTGNLYRLTLVVGAQSLTRAYVDQNNAIYAAGAWVRKE